jgi:hypothetical protein
VSHVRPPGAPRAPRIKGATPVGDAKPDRPAKTVPRPRTRHRRGPNGGDNSATRRSAP